MSFFYVSGLIRVVLAYSMVPTVVQYRLESIHRCVWSGLHFIMLEGAKAKSWTTSSSSPDISCRPYLPTTVTVIRKYYIHWSFFSNQTYDVSINVFNLGFDCVTYLEGLKWGLFYHQVWCGPSNTRHFKILPYSYLTHCGVHLDEL